MKKRVLLIGTLILIVLVNAACGPSAPSAQRPPAAEDQPEQPVATLSSQEQEALSAYLLRLQKSFENRRVSLPADPSIEPFAGAPDFATDEIGYLNFVADNVNAFWPAILADTAFVYTPPELLTFTQPGIMDTPCGSKRTTASGWIYCSTNTTVYYVPVAMLSDAIKPPNGFGLAIVIAHEYGHHLQTTLGTMKAYQEEYRKHPDDAALNNANSRKLELQADCYSGVWARSVFPKGKLNAADLLGAFIMLESLGDDTLGVSDPANQTHGSASVRMDWFDVGFTSGDIYACNTFDATQQTTDTQTLPQTDPAEASKSEVQKYFVLANDPSCNSVSDDNLATIETQRCTFTDNGNTVTVDYDLWITEDQMNGYLDRKDLSYDSFWHSSDSVYTGRIITYVADNTLYVLWGVNGKRLTGTIYWYNQDSDAALKWFADHGSHYYK